MTEVRFEHISKQFGSTVALDDIDIQINAGELFFLLGPSGCGKSTLLRLIAGLHEPTSGRIWFNGRDVTHLGTDKRNAVMCFQSYALWPHMSVRENVRFGLGVRGVSRREQDGRIDEVLNLVQMVPYADRKPNQLSGGQQQRVALARALAVKPDCLLLDEPLSNLDAKLRHEMRSEIRRICKTAGFTTIYVTHDQKEALSVADRIAVLKAGKLVQVGTPGDLYHTPNSAFVADFIGQTNLLAGTVAGVDGNTMTIDTAAGRVTAAKQNGATPAGKVTVSIRPEQMRIARNGQPVGVNRIAGQAVESTFLGEASEHVLQMTDGTRLKVIAAPPLFDVRGDLAVEFDPKDVVVLADE
ncbi:MAG TPA: ABC transporter ATP-binding protein [Tepidisphaeraceae bacterium]|jgi:iron(III) transport system ATP-binding protein|nr:ABC transporter ATP-binding protein [Tepidisphaeraceae bacterium]